MNGVRREVSPLEEREEFSFDGVTYEAFNTSGGVGTLCDTLEGKVRTLNYRMIRYPGHAAIMRRSACDRPASTSGFIRQEDVHRLDLQTAQAARPHVVRACAAILIELDPAVNTPNGIIRQAKLRESNAERISKLERNYREYATELRRRYSLE